MTGMEIILSLGIIFLSVIIMYQEFRKGELIEEINELKKNVTKEQSKIQILTDKLCETRKDLMISQGQRWLCETLSKNKTND
jgi:uncharacterized coiled-coil protein SlyX